MPTKKPDPKRDSILDEGYFAHIGQPKVTNQIIDIDEEDMDEFFGHLGELAGVFAKHFDRPNEINDLLLADYFFKRRDICLEAFWSKKDVLADLAELKQSLKTIPAVMDRLPMAVSDELRRAAIKPIIGRREDLGWGTPLSTETYLSFLPSEQAFQAFNTLQKHITGIVKLVDAATEFAETGLPVGNKGLEAWKTVDACSELCALKPGVINVPKRMNNAGPFYRLLSDVFDVMGHDEDPVSAFRGWKRHVDRTEEINP